LISKDVSQHRCSLPSQPALRLAGLSFALCSFGCSFFSGLFGIREFKSKPQPGNGNEYNGSASVGYNYLFISFPFFSNQQPAGNSHILHIRENVNYDGQFLKFPF